EGQSAEDMANALGLRIKRLEAIRQAAERLFGRPQLDRDVFRRGQPERIAHIKHPEWSATLYDLLSAYAQQRQRHALARVRFAKRTVWSLAEAREALERLIGQSADWTRLDAYLIKYVVEPSHAATVFASSFASALELVREGMAELHQHQPFAPLYVRKRPSVGGDEVERDVAPETGGAKNWRTRGEGGPWPWAWERWRGWNRRVKRGMARARRGRRRRSSGRPSPSWLPASSR